MLITLISESVTDIKSSPGTLVKKGNKSITLPILLMCVIELTISKFCTGQF